MKKSVIRVLTVLLIAACVMLAACSAPENGGEVVAPESPEVSDNVSANLPDAPEAPEQPNTPEPNAPEQPSDTEPNAPEESEEPVPLLGVWWWSDGLGDEYLDFAAENKVTEIYFCSSKFNAKTDEFIGKANAKGMSVYLLTGDYPWVENSEKLLEKIARYNNYQAAYEHKFEGIHLDIEPHQNPEFKERRTELIGKFVELTYFLKEQYPDIWFEYDLPFWLEDEVTVRGITKLAFQHVMDNASRVTLMSYRDTAEKIYGVSEAEIAYAEANDKRLNLGVLVKSNEGDFVSFQEEGKQYMYGEIARLREMLSSNYGVVIHQIKHWYDMED